MSAAASEAGPHTYLLGLGSNRRHHRHGPPRAVLAAALARLAAEGLAVKARSAVVASLPLGPSARLYANAAALIETALAPPALLALLKRIERGFGRRPGGRRWGARVLDLDIVLWSGGRWATPGLTIPHPAFRERGFVIGPAAAIAPHWRDPVTGRTLRQLSARLTRRNRLPR
ncbi:MAG: 2-amino-4-hydroxy-6-hydroxymethyldihydropteridine diphosphokinase [Porphyrobacter sp.]|nr:2-amino-4-hydroxy-6-hydroxymethyldihydropteridine diphosphokinase [Porphyrobacter sp.]